MRLTKSSITFKNSVVLSIVITVLSTLSVQRFNIISSNVNTDRATEFQLFEFPMNDTVPIKTAFFGENAYNQFLKLQDESEILFASSASFTSSLKSHLQRPVGFCAQDGQLLNKTPNQKMDALVIINNKTTNAPAIEVMDLDADLKKCPKINCENFYLHYNIRNNPTDAYQFFKAIKDNNLSGFQSHLVYTKNKSDEENFKQTNKGGNDRARRFLAICNKNKKSYNVIVDCKQMDYLMASAKNVLEYLRASNYTVDYMVNLDTGSKDILHANNGDRFVNLRPNPSTSAAMIENASSLLVYYKDK